MAKKTFDKKTLLELLQQYSNPGFRMGNWHIVKPMLRELRESCKKHNVEIPYWLSDQESE